jgi:mRNA interferase RelE/StbE
MFTLLITPDAIKTLRRMPANTARLIRSKIDRLARDPMAPSPNATKLQGRDGYRLRVGDWRVIYELDHGRRTLTVLRIGPRGGVYE